MSIDKKQISALILAGGESRRFHYVDKGLIPVNGKPMVLSVLERIAPQVGTCTINCNRNQEHYRQILNDYDREYPGTKNVLSDDNDAPLKGPLAGVYSFLNNTDAEYVFVCPCDIPQLPIDIVENLARLMAQTDAQACYPIDEHQQHHLAILVKTKPALQAIREQIDAAKSDARIDKDKRAKHYSVKAWLQRLNCSELLIEHNSGAFLNINSESDLAKLAGRKSNN